MELNEADLITRSYIHRQLGRNRAARDLENSYRLFEMEHPEIQEHALVVEFLNSKELPCISFFTFNVKDVYAEHSLFYFTHAAYYEYTQLLKRNYTRTEDLESFFIAVNIDLGKQVKAEEQRLQQILEDLAFDIRENPSKLWAEPAYLFLYHYTLESLPVDDLRAYKFMGVFNTVPIKICYL